MSAHFPKADVTQMCMRSREIRTPCTASLNDVSVLFFMLVSNAASAASDDDFYTHMN